MKQPIYRLKASTDHSYTGRQLNRDRRIRFKLNGREFKAYQGDTILSALLANGIISAGQAGGSPIALSTALDLCVRYVNAPDENASALPIDRTPVLQDMDLEVFGAPANRLKSAFGSAKTSSLKIDLDQSGCVPGPLYDAPVDARLKVNLLVVGGGIAGMTAAVTAAEAGKSVMLIERREYLGGDAELFGYADGEEDPRDVVRKLKRKTKELDKIQVFTATRALDLNDRKLLAHRVEIVDGAARASLMRVSARQIILATGAGDRLPLFPGNRQPRIFGLTEAFHLATAYGIWMGDQTAIFTNTNIAYRFAGQMQNAGAKFVGIFDARVNRSSRFIDIAKAGGQKIINAARVGSVSQLQRANRLNIALEPSQSGLPTLGDFSADQLIFNDGWQPRLDLWRRAGGKIALDGTHNPNVSAENVRLVGSCGGLKGHHGVQQSAIAAVGQMMLKKQMEVSDPQIDPQFETPEGPPTTSSKLNQPGLPPVYTSNSGSLVTLSTKEKKTLLGGLFSRKPSTEIGSIADKALSFEDVFALIQQKVLPQAMLGPVLKERVVAPHLFEAGTTKIRRKYLADNYAVEVPNFVGLRFGADAQKWSYTIKDGTPPQTGVMIFPNTDASDPTLAVGIIVGDGNLALISAEFSFSDKVLVARVGALTSTITLNRSAQI